jgi:integrase/recombinase XerD
LKLDAEQFKAWSQNLGHEYCLTTFVSYGQLPAFRQAEIMRELAKPKPTLDTEDAAAMLRKLAEQWERKQQRG